MMGSIIIITDLEFAIGTVHIVLINWGLGCRIGVSSVHIKEKWE